MQKGTKILRNMAALFMGQATTTVLSLLVAIYVPRHIGPGAQGELEVASMLATLLSTFLSVGMGTVLTRDIAREPRKAADLLGTALVIKMLMAVPAVVLLGIVSWVVGYTPETRIIIAIASVGMVFTMLSDPIQSCFQAVERMKYNSLSAVIGEVIVVVCSIAVVLAGGSVIWLSVVNVMSLLIVLFLSIKWWMSLGAVHLHFNPKLMRYLLVGGLPFWASGLFLTFYLYIDSLMLSTITSVTVVGWYSVPMKLFSFLLFLPSIIGTAMFPALVRTYKQAPREMVKIARHSFNLIGCISLPIAVGGVLLSKQIILTLYGLAYGESVPVMTVLSVMVVPMYLNIQVYQLLVVVGRQSAWTKVMAAACVINPLMNLVLIHYYQVHHQNGAFGAAWAMLLTEGLMAVVGIVLLPRGILSWSNAVSFVKSASAAGLMGLAIWYTQGYFIAIPIIVGGVIYVGAILLLGVLPHEELEMLYTVGAKVLSKAGIKRVLPQAETHVV
ncbi:MAG TPA: flippase [Ktedonobacterales bacterium]|nr:flippase [Ktedonobacterales bacterium]